MLREYTGAAKTAKLTSPLGGTTADLTLLCNDLTGWPTGTNPFWIVVNRGKANEEKILCSIRSGNNLNVATTPANGRGADGTSIASHLVNSNVEHIFTATDAREANAHVNAVGDTHGVVGEFAGRTMPQTLTNKTIDGTQNAVTNLHESDVTNLVADLAALAGADAALTSSLALKAPIANPTFTGTVVLPSTTSIGPMSSTEIGYVDGATSNIQAQLNTKAPTANPVFSGTVYLPGTTYVDGIVLGSGGLAELPDQTGHAGEVLFTDGTNPYWGVLSTAASPVDVIAVAPYPTGGAAPIDASVGCWKTYTDGVTGYQYRVHRYNYSGSPDSLVVTNGVIGNLLLVPGGGCGGAGHTNGPFAFPGGGGGAGAPYEALYAFGNGTHALYVGRGGQLGSTRDGETSYMEGYPGASLTTSALLGYGGGGGGQGGNGRDGGSGGGGAQIYGGSTSGGTATHGSSNGGASMDAVNFLGTDGGGNGGQPGGGPNAGVGLTSSITGSAVTYCVAGPGGGGTGATTPGSGGGGGAAGAGNNGGLGIDGVIYCRYRIA